MTLDVHAHVTVDLSGQLERSAKAGVDQTVLLSTRIHPEAAESLDQVRAEFARLGAVVGGAANSRQKYQSPRTASPRSGRPVRRSELMLVSCLGS